MNRTMAKTIASAIGAIALLAGGMPVRTQEAAALPRTGGAQGNGGAVGEFEGHGDVGTVLHAGAVEFDAAKGSYVVAGSGENMWGTADGFHFVWKKVSGDVTLAADISFLSSSAATGGNPHRKAVLMIRQSLEADSAYVDVALHGNGLTSLQFREEKGAITHEIQANVVIRDREAVNSAPRRLRIEKHGEYFSMYLGEGESLQLAGGSLRVHLEGPFYVGLGVCAHDKDAVEKAVFSKVQMATGTSVMKGAGPTALTLYSLLETVSIESGNRRVVYIAPERFEAPNWTRDGAAFLFNSKGRIWKLPAAGGKPQAIDTGFATRCNNDHGISPDGKLLAISDQSQGDHRSLVYIVPSGGGTPRLITKNSPSYWHGWSPDGKSLAFVGERNGDFDIYIIPVASPAAGGEEKRLTTAKGLDDGPEYSPDGKYIYFNSERTGAMQIWRMRPDGSEQEQVTADDFNNWFPHISPDGQWMVFLSYEKSVTGHPENKDVMLRLMSLKEKKTSVLAKLFGGQGTINVPSWAPDSKQLAFVSYQLGPAARAGRAGGAAGPLQEVIVSGGRPARPEMLQTEADEYTRYELLEPESASFKIRYEVTATTAGARDFYNPIRKGSVASDEAVYDAMTGEALQFEVVSGAQAQMDLLMANADPGMDYIQVHLARPVPAGGQGRLQIVKTYKDAKSYYREGDAIVFDRPLGIKRNSVVLPAGYELVACNVPSQVLTEADGKIAINFVNGGASEAHLIVKAKPGAQTGPNAAPRPPKIARSWEAPFAGETERERLSERAHQDRDIVYFLQQPETHAFDLYHDYTERREGADKYLNVVREGSTVSNPSAMVLDTGEKLATRILTGTELVAEKIDAGEPVKPTTQVVMIPFPAVKKGQSVRLRISETYTAPASYQLEGDDLVFDRSLGRPRNAVVLPAGWYLTASAIPATVEQLADGRIRLNFWNGRPDAVDVLIKAKRRKSAGKMPG